MGDYRSSSRKSLYLAVFAALFAASGAQAQTRFLPSSEAHLKGEAPSMGGRFSLAIWSHALAPISLPYASNGSSFRYQINTAIGLEVGFGVTDNIEVLLWGGYDSFDSRFNTNTGAAPRFQIVKLRHFPVGVSGRYVFHRHGWVPDVELGVGYGLGKLTVEEDFSTAVLEVTQNAPRMHAAVGGGFLWDDTRLSLHLQLGYAYQFLPGNTLTATTGSFFNTITQSALNGAFMRARVRWQF